MTTDVRGISNGLLTETKSSCMYIPAAFQPHGHHCPHTLCSTHRDLLFRPQTYHALFWLRIFPCECLFWPLIPKVYHIPPVDAFIAYLLCGSITVVVEWLICKVHFSARMKVPWGQGVWLSCFPLTLMSSTALWCIPDTQDIPIFVCCWIGWTNEWLNQASVVQTQGHFKCWHYVLFLTCTFIFCFSECPLWATTPFPVWQQPLYL